MTQTRTFVEPLGPLKTFWRGYGLAVAQRVYIGDPAGVTLPYLSLTLVDAPTDPGEAPTQRARVQHCAQAATEEDAAALIFEVVSAAESIDAHTHLDADLTCLGASLVLGPVPRIDDIGPRYLADLEFTVIAR